MPARNGILAFQSGFNTRVAADLEERLWQKLSLKASCQLPARCHPSCCHLHVALAALSCKVAEAGAKMVFISNAFSFDKATGKSGTSAPDAKFLQKLLRLDDQLWSLSERLLPDSESCIFAERLKRAVIA